MPSSLHLPAQHDSALPGDHASIVSHEDSALYSLSNQASSDETPASATDAHVNLPSPHNHNDGSQLQFTDSLMNALDDLTDSPHLPPGVPPQSDAAEPNNS